MFFCFFLGVLVHCGRKILAQHCTSRRDPRTTDTKWRHKSKITICKIGPMWQTKYSLTVPNNLGLGFWIFGHAVKAISSLGVRSPCPNPWSLMVFGSTLEGARWAFPSYSNLMKLASFLGKLQLIEIIFEGEFFSCTHLAAVRNSKK